MARTGEGEDRSGSKRRRGGDVDRERGSEGGDSGRSYDSKRSRRRRGGERSRSPAPRERPKSGGSKQVSLDFGDEEEGGERGGSMGSAPPSASNDFDSIKAVTQTSGNGEVTMSVEESNRVRALLGLKPLTVGKASAEQIAEDNMRKAKDVDRDEREAAEVKAKLDKARQRRKLKEKIKGSRLGEVGEGEEEILSAADWVKRSRVVVSDREKEKKEKEEEARKKKEAEARQSYKAKDLEGLKVTHSAEDIQYGEGVVLTLKDSSILETVEQGVPQGFAQADDELENVHLAEADKRKDAKKRAKRAKQGAYVAYDDEEFELGQQQQGGAASGKRILRHYDADADTGSQASLTLGAGGDVEGSGKANESAAAAAKRGADVASLADGGAKQIMSDYYTAQELAVFKKPKKLRKRRALRKKETELIGEDDSFEGESGGGGKGRNHGSRASRQSAAASGTAAEADTGARERQERFEAAAAKASSKQKMAVAPAARKSTTSTASSPPSLVEENEGDLAASLARAQRLAQLKQKAIANRADGGAAILEGVRAAKPEERGDAEDGMEVDEAPPRDDSRGTGSMVFTETTEFSTRLHARLEDRLRAKVVKEERGVAAAAAAAAAAADGHGDTEELKIAKKESAEEEGGARIADGAAAGVGTGDTSTITHLPQSGGGQAPQGGVAAALALFNQSGALKQTQTLSGRAKDLSRGEKGSAAAASNEGLAIEYRDEFGRPLTGKEAFRQLCYSFHGYGPGKKKVEKRLRLKDEEAKRSKARGDFDSLGSLQAAQAATAKPFVLLSGGGNLTAGLSTDRLDLSKSKASKAKGKKKIG